MVGDSLKINQNTKYTYMKSVWIAPEMVALEIESGGSTWLKIEDIWYTT